MRSYYNFDYLSGIRFLFIKGFTYIVDYFLGFKMIVMIIKDLGSHISGYFKMIVIVIQDLRSIIIIDFVFQNIFFFFFKNSGSHISGYLKKIVIVIQDLR